MNKDRGFIPLSLLLVIKDKNYDTRNPKNRNIQYKNSY